MDEQSACDAKKTTYSTILPSPQLTAMKILFFYYGRMTQMNSKFEMILLAHLQEYCKLKITKMRKRLTFIPFRKKLDWFSPSPPAIILFQ